MKDGVCFQYIYFTYIYFTKNMSQLVYNEEIKSYDLHTINDN